ncbi:MAG: hypothetical protein PHU72_09140 [Dethiosulfovibrio sp.]|nr:hypothetical protein [Dethiosulfovibrio sp.]
MTKKKGLDPLKGSRPAVAVGLYADKNSRKDPAADNDDYNND